MPQAEGLEKEFAAWVGTTYALVVNSGTAALHCSVGGLGIEPGDQVIVPA
jgi:dTDP-4-amino-4,6-dideoxygalactose transaminase